MQQANKFRPSRRAFLRTAAQIALSTGLAGCIPAQSSNNLIQNTGTVRSASLPPLPAPLSPKVDSLANSVRGRLDIPLAHKIGQMIMVGFAGRNVSTNSRIIEDVGQSKIGGVVLVGPNIESPTQLQQLTRRLQSRAASPLIIAVDQEGGSVRRLDARFGLTSNYSAHQLGMLNDLTVTTLFAGAAAQTLKNVGINLNLAPVVDLDINPQNPIIGIPGRSFSAQPEVVTRHALAFIEAHHAEGLLCTIKHFPGHGSSIGDSHQGLVDVTETWSSQELEPFAEVINADRCDMVMTAHIFNGQIDPQRPATLSAPTINGLLRSELGYDGVVVTDDLEMAAIRRYYAFEEAVELAVNAGVDIFLSSRYVPASVERTIATVVDLVERGQIREQRIDESYTRIQALKARIGQRIPAGSLQNPMERETPLPPNREPDQEIQLEKYLL